MGNYVGIFKDVSSQKAAEEELERMAYYDPLSGLPNRATSCWWKRRVVSGAAFGSRIPWLGLAATSSR